MKMREDILDGLNAKTGCEVLIIGGGINGCGLFRELALQGLDVILATKDDFATGATAAPSRMIHGGLRYLENAEFRLVRESLAERDYLLRKASHYVKALPTTIPIFSRFGGLDEIVKKLVGISRKPGKRGAIWVKIGLSFYDFFTRHERLLPKHRFLRKNRAIEKYPILNPAIVGTATYYDAWVSYPERLCQELVMDAEGPGAIAVNYLELVGIKDDRAHLRCTVSGRSLHIRPRILVNATGAWIDETNRRLSARTEYIGGTKGSHIVIDNPALRQTLKDEMLLYENPDGRVCLVFGFHDKVLAGSTDIPVKTGDDGICDDSEVEYILKSLRDLLPETHISHEQIIYRFCGVRPLPKSDAATPGQVSRDHSCKLDEPTAERAFPIYSLVGGKWTTFRAFAEQVCDSILERLDLKRSTSTSDLAIGGGKDLPQEEQEKLDWIRQQPTLSQFPEDRARQLVDRYGTKAEAVGRFILEGNDQLLPGQSGYSERELEYIIDNEAVVRLEDLLVRRTSIAILGHLNFQLVAEAASLCAARLDWSPEREREEIELFTESLKVNNGVILSPETTKIS